MARAVSTTARRLLVRLLAERIVRQALAEQPAGRAIIPALPPTEPAHARRPVRPVLIRPAAPDLDR